MNKNTFLALLLTAVVIIGLPALFPGSRRQPPRPAGVDSAAVGAQVQTPAPTAVAAAPQTPGAQTP